MRIVRLDLKRFGHFTDRSLDLSAGQLGQSGVHLIYGPNEAGKSTALRALQQCFYGIPARTDDGFLHPYTALRIGAVLARGDGETLETLECIRRKGNQKTLRAADDETVIDDRELAAWLGGVDEETFRLRYGINYEQLVAGGKEIVAGHGDLGQSLFAAGAGIANLRDVQQRLEAEAGDLFKPTGRNPRINELARDLKAAHDRVRQLRLSTSEWKKHDKAFGEAEQRYDAVRASEGGLVAERGRLARLRDAVPLATTLARLESELAPRKGTPILSDDFSERRAGVQSRLGAAQSNAEQARGELDELEKNTASLSVPASLLQHKQAIRQCYEKSGVVRQAENDRPALQVELTEVEAEMRQLLRRLGAGDRALDELETLRIPDAEVMRIQDLSAERKALETSAEEAQRQLSRLQRRTQTAQASLTEIGKPADATQLRDALRKVERELDLEPKLYELETASAVTAKEADIELDALGLFTGDLDAARRLAVPDQETCDHWDQKLQAAEALAADLQETLAEERRRRTQLTERLEELRLAQDVPTEDDLNAARRRRDEGWRLVRDAWLACDSTKDGAAASSIRAYTGSSDEPEQLAGAFERDVTAADETADRLRREADRVAQKLRLLSERRSVGERIETLEQQLAAAESSLDARRDEWMRVWSPLGIQPRSPREMMAWLRRHACLSATVDRLRQAQGELETLSRRIDNARQHLFGALQSHIEEESAKQMASASPADLLITARQHLDALESAQRRHDALTEEIQQLETEAAEVRQRGEEAKERFVEWKTQWSRAMQRLDLQDDASPSQANAVINLLSQLHKYETRAIPLRQRLTDMAGYSDEFARQVRTLAEEIATDLAADDPLRVAEQLNNRLSEAIENQARRDEQVKRKDRTARRLRDARRTEETESAALAALCEEAGCHAPEELVEAERRSRERQEKQRELRSVQQQLESLAAGTPFEEFLKELREHDFDDLGLRIRALDDELEELKRQRETSKETMGAERNELARMNGGPDAAEAEEEAQSLLAELRSKCEEYARLKLASAVLAESIERYRQRHQGPILEKAGELFAELTLGSFNDLKAEFFDSDQPELVGVRPDGETVVRVSGMSEGTCDQLYLALRLASLEHELEHRDPLPLVVDDVLIMFDDDRSAAALKALARLSEKTQVILFTHHEHLVQLARQTLDDDVLFVQQLDAAATSAAQTAAT